MNMRDPKSHSLYVSGVCCAAEETVIRKHLNALVGEDDYSFNSLTHELCLRDESQSECVTEKLHALGFAARSRSELEHPGSFWERHRDGVLTGVAALLVFAGLMAPRLGASELVEHCILLCAIVIGGFRIFVRAWKSVRTYAFDMNVLMSAAVIGSLVIGKWGEGALVVILFAISLMLESYSNARTRRAIQSLMKLAPDQACLVLDNREVMVAAKDLEPGQQILVRPGDRIAIDGIVADGRSYVDQAAITGESIPVVKSVGDNVFAGSVNQNGALRMNVTSRHEDTSLARIIHLVENAQLKRAPVQNVVDKFARIYTPTVMVIAAGIAAIPPLFMNAPFGEWFYRALVLLVIACPCALVISTPVTIVSALARAARWGILIKGGRHVETVASMRAIAFDKTGTLTEGKPVVTDVISLDSVDREHMLHIVAALEHRSEHPVASAVMKEVARTSTDHVDLSVEDFAALPGLGVTGRIAGEEYFLGNSQLCETRGLFHEETSQILKGFERDGKTAIILGNSRKPLGVIAMQDLMREQGNRAVSTLRTLGIRHMMLLSGDNETSVERIASLAGITHYKASLLPQQKIMQIEELKTQHGTVAMVGDGINDAPALAAASVGIAMGVGGSDTALETADVVLMGDDLSKLPLLVRLCRNAMDIVKQNIVIALSLKLLFILLSITGVATLWMAVLADDGAALIVIFNGLRVLSMKKDL